jgi:hypothetical protein
VELMTKPVTRSCSLPLRGEWLKRSALAPVHRIERNVWRLLLIPSFFRASTVADE